MAATLAGWIAYAALRGLTVANETASEQALVRGTDYIRFNYINKFLPGYDETSPYVDDAIYEAAAFELTTPGFWTSTFTPSQQKVLTRAGDIGWTVTGGTDSNDAWINASPTSTKIAAMLSPYMPGRFQIGLKAIGL
jgi:hypothetical protein